MRKLTTAVLDTNVLILLLTSQIDDSLREVEDERKRQAVICLLDDLRKTTHRMVVPTPVIAELSRDGKPLEMLQALTKTLGRIRVAPLDQEAAVVAAQMAKDVITKRAPGQHRGALKYDTLICAIAHAIGAHLLLTDDSRDMKAPLLAVNSAVEVVVATDPPAKGQSNIYQLPSKGA